MIEVIMEFERRRGRHNIVLKARQMGMTTWAAARFFLRTITQPGTLTLEVAHTQEAAEEIFRIVHRFLDCLPEDLREGALRRSRQIISVQCLLGHAGQQADNSVSPRPASLRFAKE